MTLQHSQSETRQQLHFVSSHRESLQGEMEALKGEIEELVRLKKGEIEELQGEIEALKLGTPREQVPCPPIPSVRSVAAVSAFIMVILPVVCPVVSFHELFLPGTSSETERDARASTAVHQTNSSICNQLSIIAAPATHCFAELLSWLSCTECVKHQQIDGCVGSALQVCVN
jgi:hypothetical protein